MRLVGFVYRAHHPAWAFLPTSGRGAASHGGRFNAKGVEALYASRRIETAWLEAQQSLPFKAQPQTMCAYRVDCDDVVDLTDEAERRRLGVEGSDLACPWEDMADRGLVPPSWSLAGRLVSDGAAGAVAPSFAPGATSADVNVVFWRWGDALPHQAHVVDDLGRLPKNDQSWR